MKTATPSSPINPKLKQTLLSPPINPKSNQNPLSL